MPLAKWVAITRSELTAEEFKNFQSVSARVVNSDTYASYWPNMDSMWIEMKKSVEELQGLLSIDFSQEIETIEREIENAEKPDPISHQVGKQFHLPKGSTIDSIFESLLDWP